MLLFFFFSRVYPYANKIYAKLLLLSVCVWLCHCQNVTKALCVGIF